MATKDNNNIKTRVQLKSDTEARWNAIGSTFIPMYGEVIVYINDNTHDYPRMKIGDGSTTLNSLYFLDAGTVNGYSNFIVKYANQSARPAVGDPNLLYIDLSTNKIYRYQAGTGYVLLADLDVQVTTSSVKEVVSFEPGAATNIYVMNGILYITNSIAPKLYTQDTTVVTGITT